jgi:hypothetical protein
MGLFDRLPGRLFGSRPAPMKVSGQSEPAKPKKEQESFFLDPDASTSLGDVNFMRRSNTIRHTFPGNADSPGDKEMVAEVASMEARLERMTPGLAGTSTSSDTDVNLTGGVPKQVKKTFAQQITGAVLEQRLKGSAVKGVNETAAAGPARKEKEGTGEQPRIAQQTAKPGTTDPFRSMAKDLNV